MLLDKFFATVGILSLNVCRKIYTFFVLSSSWGKIFIENVLLTHVYKPGRKAVFLCFVLYFSCKSGLFLCLHMELNLFVNFVAPKMTLEKWTGHFLNPLLYTFTCDVTYGLRLLVFNLYYFFARAFRNLCCAIGWNPDLSKPAQRTTQKVSKSGSKLLRLHVNVLLV